MFLVAREEAMVSRVSMVAQLHSWYSQCLQGVLFGMKPYKMLVLPICMAKQVKFVEFRPNEDFSSICVFFYISMSNF